MTFLKLLSENAYQNFTYSCMHGVAWYSEKEDNYDYSIRLLGENEIEIGYEDAKLKPNILVDGCKVRKCAINKI